MGISPDVFWSMTPWQYGCCVEAYGVKVDYEHDDKAWFMWHQEGLARSKKMPPLKDFLASEMRQRSKDGKEKNKVPRIDEGAIMARLEAYKKRFKAEKGGGE